MGRNLRRDFLYPLCRLSFALNHARFFAAENLVVHPYVKQCGVGVGVALTAFNDRNVIIIQCVLQST